jgi:hypothetical protein
MRRKFFVLLIDKRDAISANLGAMAKLVLFKPVLCLSLNWNFAGGRQSPHGNKPQRKKKQILHRLCCPFIDLFGATHNTPHSRKASPERREKNFFSIETSHEAMESEKHV